MNRIQSPCRWRQCPPEKLIILHLITHSPQFQQHPARKPADVSRFLACQIRSLTDSSRPARSSADAPRTQNQQRARTGLTTIQFASKGLDSQSNTLTLRNKALRGLSELQFSQSVTPRVSQVTRRQSFGCVTAAHSVSQDPIYRDLIISE